jgi:hypothetical protein
MRKIVIMSASVLLAGCAGGAYASSEREAASEAVKLERALAGKVAGKPQSCISLRDINGPESIGENTLLFRVNRKLTYRTETRGSCRRVGNDRALITQIYGSSQLCRGDIAQSADLTVGATFGSCAMGDFVPYRGS